MADRSGDQLREEGDEQAVAVGLAIGRGQTRPQGVTVEGASTAKAVSALANARNLDVPLTDTVAALIEDQLSVAQAIGLLLSRPLKEE